MPVYGHASIPVKSQECTHLLSVSIDLSFLDISCKWNHTIQYVVFCGWLLSLSTMLVHPCCSMYHFIPFTCWIVFYCMDASHFAYPPPHLWNLKLTPKTIKTSHIQHPTIFCLYQKINNEQMISPLKKKHLHLKNGMRWDTFLFKNVSRATKKLHLRNSW